MKVKLVEPTDDKNWSLQFFEVSLDLVTRQNIIYWCLHYGNHFRVSPFVQGNCDDWIMIEFWNYSQSYILEACCMICKELNVELDL